MLLPIKCICPRSKKRLDGTTIVFIQYCYNATQRTLLNTEIAISVEFWNKKQRCIPINFLLGLATMNYSMKI